MERKRPGGPLHSLGETAPKENKDQEYAERFWVRQPKGVRESMIENIHKAAESGFIGVFAPEIEEYQKEKLSAYRLLAQELGYEVGQFKLNRDSGTVLAPIKKKGE